MKKFFISLLIFCLPFVVNANQFKEHSDFRFIPVGFTTISFDIDFNIVGTDPTIFPIGTTPNADLKNGDIIILTGRNCILTCQVLISHTGGQDFYLIHWLQMPYDSGAGFYNKGLEIVLLKQKRVDKVSFVYYH